MKNRKQYLAMAEELHDQLANAHIERRDAIIKHDHILGALCFVNLCHEVLQSEIERAEIEAAIPSL